MRQSKVLVDADSDGCFGFVFAFCPQAKRLTEANKNVSKNDLFMEPIYGKKKWANVKVYEWATRPFSKLILYTESVSAKRSSSPSRFLNVIIL